MTGMQEMIVRVPANEWMSANDRMHWGQRSGRTKRLRRRGYFEARRNGLLPMARAFVVARVQYAKGVSRADPANAYPTVKALIDGAVDFGVLADDDSEHLIGPKFEREPGACDRGWHVIRLVFIEQEVPF